MQQHVWIKWLLCLPRWYFVLVLWTWLLVYLDRSGNLAHHAAPLHLCLVKFCLWTFLRWKSSSILLADGEFWGNLPSYITDWEKKEEKWVFLRHFCCFFVYRLVFSVWFTSDIWPHLVVDILVYLYEIVFKLLFLLNNFTRRNFFFNTAVNLLFAPPAWSHRPLARTILCVWQTSS